MSKVDPRPKKIVKRWQKVYIDLCNQKLKKSFPDKICVDPPPLNKKLIIKTLKSAILDFGGHFKYFPAILKNDPPFRFTAAKQSRYTLTLKSKSGKNWTLKLQNILPDAQ